MTLRLVRCDGCHQHYPTREPGFRCTICHTPASQERDAAGNVIREFDARGRVIFMTRSNSSRELWDDEPGPRRATPAGALAALDHITSNPGPFGALT